MEKKVIYKIKEEEDVIPEYVWKFYNEQTENSKRKPVMYITITAGTYA